jgi:ribosomal protein L7/L12
MPGLNPDQVQQIHGYIHNQQLIHAIKLYREATGVSLAEAKDAVEAMARGEAIKPPSGVRDYDNPILDGRIKSMLSKGQKVEAVRIYREEYGIGLKEAKDAVDRIEASMRSSGSSMNVPYESAISGDPFAEDDGAVRRTMIILAAVVALAVCGAGVFFLLLSL